MKQSQIVQSAINGSDAVVAIYGYDTVVTQVLSLPFSLLVVREAFSPLQDMRGKQPDKAES